MINFTYLLGVSLICLNVLILRNRTKRSQLSGFYASLLFATLSIISLSCWNWSRIYAGPGLLGFMTLSQIQANTLDFILLISSFGFFLGGITLRLFLTNGSQSRPFGVRIREFRITDQMSKFVLSVCAIILLISLGGEGTSIFARDQYPFSNGIVTLERAATALSFAAYFLLASTATMSKNHRYIKASWFLAGIWLIVLVGKGSRESVILTIIMFATLFLRKRRTIAYKLRYTLIATLGVLTTYSLTFVARSGPHGILRIPLMLKSDLLIWHNFSNLRLQVGRLIASLFSWVNVIPRSVGTLQKDVLIQNINPLIGTGSDPFSYSTSGVERLFPYTWVPLSSAGQFYGLLGGLGLFAIIFMLTIVSGLGNFQCSRGPRDVVFRVMSNGTFVLQILFYLQYSTRIWFRVLWLFIGLSLVHFIIEKRADVSTSIPDTSYSHIVSRSRKAPQ